MAEKPRKQTSEKQVNLRCPVCEYLAKTTEAFMQIGRLRCPVHRGEMLLTKEEREMG